MSKRKLTLEHFFKSKQTLSTPSCSKDSAQADDSDITCPLSRPSPGCSGYNATETDEGRPTSISNIKITVSTTGNESSLPTCNRLDIGLHNGKQLSNELKYDLLTNVWTPPERPELYRFPPGQRNLKFQRPWLAEFPWLCYSEYKQGAFCKYCTTFANENSVVGKGSHMKLGFFVNEPFVNWKKAKENFRSHESAEYHKKFSIMAQNFMSVYEKKMPDVASQIDTGRKLQIAENRKRLIPIIKTVILCGRQELALRGHRDQGPLVLEEPSKNDGNFRALLRYRIDGGDETLKQHVTTCGLNASYLSYKIQNEIINTCGDVIQTQIVDNINKAECFSVLADETSDISGVEQFTLGVRYTCKDNEDKYVLREDFLKFVPVTDTKGVTLANTLKQSLSEMGINLNHLRGQGYDGATSMSGKFQGCAVIMREQFPQAVYVHCASHSLNLALCHSCNIPVIRNCLGTMKEVITFFRVSPKRSAVFTKFVQESNPTGTKKTRLTKFCETRWVEHLDAIMLFKDMFHIICKALKEIQEHPDSDSETSSKAYSLLTAIEKCSFVAAMTSVSNIFSLSHNLSTSLQSETIDLVYFLKYADDLKKEVLDMRMESEAKFKYIFKDVIAVCEAADIDIDVPRRASRQTHRDNYSSDEPETYYRCSVFIPFLDYFLQQLDVRFLNHRTLLESLQFLLPHHCCSLGDKEIQEISDKITEFWPNDTEGYSGRFHSELIMWKRKWLQCESKKPKYFISCLNECDKHIFPSLHKILKIGATIPVTTATCERSFSTLRRVKSYLRNTTGQERLNGLALMSIHRDVPLNPEEILNKLAHNKSRRLDLIL
jgi:hypothetical protein